MEENAFQGLAPSLSSAPPATDDPSFHRYDVFINHRGPDVKNTLASVIYQFLQYLGLKVFLDSQELQLGDILPGIIQQAIRSSRVHIAIFSQGYANSPWCLAELQLMLKTGAKIVPLFYDVKPYDLRYTETGVYADAFTKYREKERYIDKLEQWKQALREASFITGIEVDSFSGNMGNLYKNIVDTVFTEVRNGKSKFKLEVADHPVGLDEAIKELEDKISSTAQISIGYGKFVVIFGSAGVGKTTLAKEFYNRKHPMFCRSSFLSDVGKAYRNKNMAKMQYKLMCDLSMPLPLSSATFPHSGPKDGFGVEMIKSQLDYWYSKPLVVIDGVDNVDQLEALALREFLSHGALVIVTCGCTSIRFPRRLQSFGMLTRYDMKGLDQKYARQLFCWHAFGQSDPPLGREELVETILKGSDGLPSDLISLARATRSIRPLQSIRPGQSIRRPVQSIRPGQSIRRPVQSILPGQSIRRVQSDC